MMNFFDINQAWAPNGEYYYFDVCVVNIAVCRSQAATFEDIWDLSGVLNARPIVYHLYLDDMNSINIYHHCVVAVNESLGVSFFETDLSEGGDKDGEFADPDDLWRF